MAEKLLTIREVAYILGISEKEVIDLDEKREITAYKVGGVYLRFQKDQIDQFLRTFDNQKPHQKVVSSSGERLRDFFYFYDFYIIATVIIVTLLVIISRG